MKISKNLIIHFVVNILLIFFIALAYFWKGTTVGIVGLILLIIIGFLYANYWIIDINSAQKKKI